jgi:hypothetical protein
VLRFPTLIASHFTSNFAILRLIYNSCHVAIPAIALAASWIVCGTSYRSRFAWPALSICLASLPGQFAFHAEGFHGANLLWPGLLFALGDLSFAHLPLVMILAVGAWGAHPVVAVHLATVAIAAFLTASARPAVRRRALGFGAVMMLMALARVFKPLGAYETKTLGLGVLKFTFYSAVLGWPLISMLLTLIAAAALVWSSARRQESAIAARIATIAVVLGGLCLVPWATNSANWIDAQGFRFWYPGIALILMFGAVAEAFWSSISEELNERRRAWCLISLGSVFLLVLSLQSIAWRELSRRLTDLIATSQATCVPRAKIGWFKNTPFQHWSTDFYVVALQSKKPSMVVLEGDDCAVLSASGGLRLDTWDPYREPPDGWFDFSRVRAVQNHQP